MKIYKNNKSTNYIISKNNQQIADYIELENNKTNYIYCVLSMQNKVTKFFHESLYTYHELENKEQETLENIAYSLCNCIFE